MTNECINTIKNIRIAKTTGFVLIIYNVVNYPGQRAAHEAYFGIFICFIISSWFCDCLSRKLKNVDTEGKTVKKQILAAKVLYALILGNTFYYLRYYQRMECLVAIVILAAASYKLESIIKKELIVIV